MYGINHAAIALAVGLPIAIKTGNLETGTIAALTIGSLLPDIDTPYSLIGRKTRGVSDAINLAAGHRGFTHWLVGAGTAIIAAFIFCIVADLNIIWAVAFTIGYLLHLLTDSFSKSGIDWLKPFKNKTYRFGGNLSYRVGGLAERIIGSIAMLTIIIIVGINLTTTGAFEKFILNIVDKSIKFIGT